jgi:cytochrome c-type biogenesis protein CcmH
MMRWFIIMLGLLSAVPAFAVNPNEQLADPALEARARALSGQLRCLVCQSESIDDSNATLAHDLRVLVRERLTAGDSDEQVLAYLRARYGDYVLLNPPIERATWLLWFGPGVLLAAVLLGVGVAGARQRPVSPVPLDAEEQARLEALLKRDES